MTVRADRNKILLRIDHVAFAQARHGFSVMNVNEALAMAAVLLLKGERTDGAARSVKLNAVFASPSVALVSIDPYLPFSALYVLSPGGQFVWK